jgi:thymidylate synthase (FAD)
MAESLEKLSRASVPEMDDILGVPFPVLDDGFVRVIDYMGSDRSIVQAARVSYGAGTKKRHEDRGLIRYLLRNHHTSPFEMCDIKLHVRVPMDTWRQWIRHRTASVNEYSTRYSIAIDAAQRTAAGAWRLQATSNRQGSEGNLPEADGRAFSAQEEALHRAAREAYEQRIASGIAREQARKDLPLSTYTEAYWKINLHNILHFLRLRMEAHAQLEVRLYAETIGREIVARWCPFVWEAFQDYALASVELSRLDGEIVSLLAAGRAADALVRLREEKFLPPEGGELRMHVEREELERKLRALGIPIPWIDASALDG